MSAGRLHDRRQRRGQISRTAINPEIETTQQQQAEEGRVATQAIVACEPLTDEDFADMRHTHR